MVNPIKILVIDDEPQIRRFLKASLDPKMFAFTEAVDADSGMRLIALENPDVVLLDLGLPDLDGIEVARQVREWSQVPIIVLSARGQETDKVKALDAGADDYLTKPFGVGELLARIRVALRHANKGSQSAESVFEVEGLRVDVPLHRVIREGEEVHLTKTEFKIMALLIRHVGKVLTHRQILTEVWGPAYADENHYLRVYMGQLRHKLEKNPGEPKYLITEPGVGYRLRGE